MNLWILTGIRALVYLLSMVTRGGLLTLKFRALQLNWYKSLGFKSNRFKISTTWDGEH